MLAFEIIDLSTPRPRVNIKQLETFLAIIRHGSFAAAADRLNATQSTISARIQELELDLGIHLFDRSQRKVSLTAKGRELLPFAEQAVALFGEIKLRVGTTDALSGIVRLGVSELVALTWFPALAALIRERYPKLTLEVDIALTLPLLRSLRTGELDIVLVPGSTFDPDFTARGLGSVRFAWMAGGSAAISPGVLEPKDLARWRILSLGADSIHHGTVQDWLTKSGGKLQHVDLCNSMAVIASLTIADFGISLLPPSSYQDQIASGALKVLETRPPGPDVDCFAVYQRRSSDTVAATVTELAIEASTFARKPA